VSTIEMDIHLLTCDAVRVAFFLGCRCELQRFETRVGLRTAARSVTAAGEYLCKDTYTAKHARTSPLISFGSMRAFWSSVANLATG